MAEGKKAKSPGKAKKGKDGGKAKPGKKASSPAKAASATPTQEQSSTQELPNASSQDTTAGSTASLVSGQSGASTPTTWPFKPLNRPMLPPLVLPADRSLSLTRRPSPIIVREWNDVWFFPLSVLALALVVLGMITLSLQIKGAPIIGDLENHTSDGNATASNGEELTTMTGLALQTAFTKPKGTKETPMNKLSTSMPTPVSSKPKVVKETPESKLSTSMPATGQAKPMTDSGDKPTPQVLPVDTEGMKRTPTNVEEHGMTSTLAFSKPMKVTETSESELSEPVPTSEAAWPGEVSTLIALPFGTEDEKLTATMLEEDSKAATSEGSELKSTGTSDMHSDNYPANISLGFPGP